MNISEYNPLSDLQDIDLINGLALNEDYLAVIYKKHKSYCIKFMQKISGRIEYDEVFSDIYHDAILVLYEKVRVGTFLLTSSIQTYLNSICRYQLLNRFKDAVRTSAVAELADFDNQQNTFRDDFADSLANIESDDIKNERVQAIVKSLEVIKEKGDCYQLLSMVYYHNNTMKQIVDHFGYKNEQIAKNKNYLCKEKLKSLTFERMKRVR